jgi:predicted RNA-binding protein with TRAM domain
MLSTLKPEPATHADPFHVVVVCAQAGDKPMVNIEKIRRSKNLLFNNIK